MGRAYQRLGENQLAMKYYQITIKYGSGKKDYFAPASCLQAGILSEAEGQLSEAEKYYRRVLDYENYPYQRSFRQKSKAALSRLQKN